MEDHDGKKKRITINDIARVTGYSKTAISFAFNDPSRISDQACTTILQVAEQLGYYPDPLARRFSLQKHESIGFLLPQELRFAFRNPYTMHVIEGIGTICQEHGNTLTLIPPLNESVIAAVRGAAVDAFIILGANAHMETVESINRRGLPFVSIDGVPTEGIASVNIDDRQAAYDMMRTVLDAGHRKIAIVGLTQVEYETADTVGIQDKRLQGYREALREEGLDLDSTFITYFESDCSIEEGRHIADTIAMIRCRPTCVVTMSDIVAIGVWLRFSELGLDVPKDISIVGFDNIQESMYTKPPLTTVSQPSVEKGKHAARLLFSLMDGSEPVDGERHIVLPYHLIVRDSLAAITGNGTH